MSRARNIDLSSHRSSKVTAEDLQWADGGTLDLIVALAERSTRCRLMVLATYRAIEAGEKKFAGGPAH